MRYDKVVSDNIFNLLVSGETYNHELANLQTGTYPAEYAAAQDRVVHFNHYLCDHVKTLVADTLFDRYDQHLKNAQYRQIFTNRIIMFQLEIASHQSDVNISLMFLHCVPKYPHGIFGFFSTDDLYTGGRYEIGANYSVRGLPTWVEQEYNVFSDIPRVAALAQYKLKKFRSELGTLLKKLANQCPQYALIQDIAQKITK